MVKMVSRSHWDAFSSFRKSARRLDNGFMRETRNVCLPVFISFFFLSAHFFQIPEEEHQHLVSADHLNHSGDYDSFADDPTWLNLVDEFKYEAAKASGKSKFDRIALH